ncbi:hypothetical protein K7G98_13935 [Saccharothrix sp. MB29]|nr:hypothetical protein [Saccharothrix sp. MB29]
MRVVPDQDGSGNVVVTYPDGQQVRFGRNAENGSFDPPAGRFATFYQDFAQPARPYVLVDKSNSVYTFREFDGRLITVHDNAGRAVSWTTGRTARSNGPSAGSSGNAAADRTLYFAWTGNHVTEVRTDRRWRRHPIRWTYEYVGDRLTKVCDPRAAARSTSTRTARTTAPPCWTRAPTRTGGWASPRLGRRRQSGRHEPRRDAGSHRARCSALRRARRQR